MKKAYQIFSSLGFVPTQFPVQLGKVQGGGGVGFWFGCFGFF